MNSSGEFWTEEEDRILTELYPKTGVEGVLPKLTKRSKASIISRACNKNLRYDKRRKYTESDKQFIRDHYEKDGWKFVADQLNRSKLSILAKAMQLGVRSGYKYKRGEENKQFKGHGCISGGLWGRIKKGSKKRGFNFDITIQYAWDLFEKQGHKCALSGLDLSFSTLSCDSDGTASLDRIDSTKGYIPGNVQWVHKHINKMKWDLEQKAFLFYCCSICAHNNLQSSRV